MTVWDGAEVVPQTFVGLQTGPSEPDADPSGAVGDKSTYVFIQGKATFVSDSSSDYLRQSGQDVVFESPSG